MIESFESDMCAVCTRAIPNNDVSKEHYLCKECLDDWFPKADKSDCMEEIANCGHPLKDYEIINKHYECPLCDEGYYWDKENHECSEC